MFINFLNIIISKLKGEPFYFHNKVPLMYLLNFFLSKAISLSWGIVRLKTMKFVFVHPSTMIRCNSKIFFGKNFSIDRGCYVDALSQNGLICGHNVSIGKNTCIECTGSLRCLGKGFKVGNNVGLGTHGFFGAAGGIEIGDDTIIGNYVSFHSENHNFYDKHVPIRLQGVNHKGIKIGNNCWIGAKATFLDGAEIGDGCIVAAGAVVRGVFPPDSIIGGIPAKIIKKR